MGNNLKNSDKIDICNFIEDILKEGIENKGNKLNPNQQKIKDNIANIIEKDILEPVQNSKNKSISKTGELTDRFTYRMLASTDKARTSINSLIEKASTDQEKFLYTSAKTSIEYAHRAVTEVHREQFPEAKIYTNALKNSINTLNSQLIETNVTKEKSTSQKIQSAVTKKVMQPLSDIREEVKNIRKNLKIKENLRQAVVHPHQTIKKVINAIKSKRQR